MPGSGSEPASVIGSSRRKTRLTAPVSYPFEGEFPSRLLLRRNRFGKSVLALSITEGITLN